MIQQLAVDTLLDAIERGSSRAPARVDREVFLLPPECGPDCGSNVEAVDSRISLLNSDHTPDVLPITWTNL